MKLALAVLLFFLVTTLAKHHSHKYSCPVLRKCPTHKHKVCGSDGKLYNSHCNLRKAACESDIPLRAVHPDRCSGDDDTDEYGKVASRAATGPRGPQNSSMSSRDEDECNAQSYDILKEQILLKIKDISLLFTQLDENSDGSININELWKKSGTLKLTSTPCLLTDLLQHEDKNQDEVLDYSEFQDAFANLYTVSMVTLDQNLAVNKIQAHIGDNVEIRCDISGKPQLPVIKWFRYNIDLATVNMVNMKVFSDGSLYLTNVQISFSGNYTCQAESNPAIKQVHILHVIVSPSVDVRPPFQWSVPGGFASIDCQYENLADEAVRVHWLKNDEPLEANSRMTIMNNATRIQIGDLQRSDTGAYSCRVENCRDTAIGQSIASVLVQEDPVGSSPSKDKKKLWVFHGNGVSIFNGGCSGLVHEIDGRDIMPQNGLALCGRTETEEHPCQWAAEGPVMAENRIYAAQPTLNRIIVFHVVQMNVIQVIVTDPRPTRLWLVPSEKENRIWVLCHGEPERTFGASSPTGHVGKKESDIRRKESFGSYEEERSADQFEFEWTSSSSGKNEQQRKNRKTVQIIRISGNLHNQNVIHLQPIDGHFDLVYDLFVPRPSSILSDHFYANNRFAYVTHWDERALVKIDMEQFKYLKTINLVECQPLSALFTDFGLIILQCQTPVTHQLNGQLLVDQLTDAIIGYNPHVKAHKAFLSPNQHFVVNVVHNSTSGSTSTTIIVQKVSRDGVQFMYDVRTTLNIVNCEFIWKNGNYDAILASATPNREDLLYLSLIDGRVELISGIGRPTDGSHRSMGVSENERLAAVSSLESVFIVDLTANRVMCETQQRHRNPRAVLWT